jgi:putative flippase GtrA
MPTSHLNAFLAPFFTKKFVKFCAVGASGVVVNLGILAVLRNFDVRSSYASAIAIEVSILTNFIMNEWWTFRDRRHESGFLARTTRFQVVSHLGALVQWTVFLLGNLACLWWLSEMTGVTAYLAQGETGLMGTIKHLIVNPPEVGGGIYLSQLVGIGVATVWNYLANFYWTWKASKPEPA